jgi:quinol-cytochrome oxidoreductase complex cytochrome b subunit
MAVTARPVRSWLDERLGLRQFNNAIFLRHVPVGLSWWYSLGAATLFVLAIQFVTGILLALNYAPTPEFAYDSVQYTTTEVPFGWFIRGLHHWGASALVVLVLLHMLSAFVLGAHRYPREATWLVGVGLFLLILAFGFTGYLLPWDQKSYWATTVGTNMAGTVPVIGGALERLLRGGSELGAVALSHFYAIHVLVLPALLMAGVLAHVALVIYHGVSVPPGLWSRATGSYRERYRAAKEKGPMFWPEVIVEDLRLATLIFVALIALTVLFGVPMEDRADPTDTAYIPRPEWYFLFLFQLLKYFPGSLEWVGVVVVPGLLLLLLVLAPWLSRGEERRPRKRPLGIAVVAGFIGLSSFLTYQAAATTPPSQVVEHGRVLTSLELRGKQLIDQQGCTSCHVIGGVGEKKGPPLDGIGERVTAADIHFFMERPNAVNPGATMKPLIPPLTHEDVEAITQYLLTLNTNDGGSTQ